MTRRSPRPAFTVFGATSEAQQLLDQLAALQHTDGSIEIAFNVADGTTESVFRSGTIATVGLAGSFMTSARTPTGISPWSSARRRT